MPAPRKYPNELRERAIRLVTEARQEEPELSMTAAVHRIGPRVGVNADTLRGWCKQADIDAGRRAGTATGEAAELKALRQKVKEHLVGGLECLRAGARPATALVVLFIELHRERFGVEPMCGVLAQHLSPSPRRPGPSPTPSARARRGEVVLAEIRRVQGDPTIGRGLYGVGKVW